MINYGPLKTVTPERILNVASAWKGLESIILDILDRFQIGRDTAIEFGVQYGYSLVVLSNYFNQITGVDHFQGDKYAGSLKSDTKDSVMKSIEPYKNISMVDMSYEQYIKDKDQAHFNLAHIDIIHDYDPTYLCGEWCCRHADIVIFHDTESFMDVRRACENLAAQFNRVFYNYNKCFGLGILAKREI